MRCVIGIFTLLSCCNFIVMEYDDHYSIEAIGDTYEENTKMKFNGKGWKI